MICFWSHRGARHHHLTSKHFYTCNYPEQNQTTTTNKQFRNRPSRAYSRAWRAAESGREMGSHATHRGDNEAEKWLFSTRRMYVGHDLGHTEAALELQLFFLLGRRLLWPAWMIAIDDIRFQNARILVRSKAAVERFLPDIPLRSLLHSCPLFNVGRGKAFAQQGKALDTLCQRVSIAVIRYALGKGAAQKEKGVETHFGWCWLPLSCRHDFSPN